MIVLNKIATLLFWLLAALAWLQGWDGWLAWLPPFAVLVAAIHALEVAYFWLGLKQHSQQPGLDALQVFVFGIFHLQRFIRPAPSS